MFCRTIGQVLGPSFRDDAVDHDFDANVHRLVPPDKLAGLDVEELRSNSKTIRDLAEPTHSQVIEALRLGINDAFRFAALMSALGIITSLFMKSCPLRGTIRE